MVDLNESEIKAINELRESVKDELTEYYDTDFNILRWVQGHNERLEEAAKKLKVHLKTRKSYWNLDALHEQPRSHTIHKYIPYGVTGRAGTQENLIVYVEQCGTSDYHGMLQTFSIQEIMKANLRDMEGMLSEVMRLEKETGRQAWILYVMDLSGVTYDKKLFDLSTGPLKSLSEFMQEHYVELMKYFVLVNAPSFVYVLWTMVKPVLPEKTIQKVKILSSSNWRDEILQLSSPGSLPSFWNNEHFNLFKAPLALPIEFPAEDYYLSKEILPSDVKKIRIVAGKFLIIEKMLEEGDILEWWVTGDANFSMGVFFNEENEKKNVEEYFLVSQKIFFRMDTVYPVLGWMPGPTIVPMNDRFIAMKDGVYHIWLSNHRAWWRTLTLLAKFSVISSAEVA